MTGWCWFALVDGPLGAALGSWTLAAAPARHRSGAPAGTFAAWPPGRKPVASALRMDRSLVDPRAPEAWVSLVAPPPDLAPPFDDVAVGQAMRGALRGGDRTAVSTLVRDGVTFGGALTVTHAADPRPLLDDPFARLYPARVLRAGAGMFGVPPTPAGPAIQRYAGQPWPVAGFPTGARG